MLEADGWRGWRIEIVQSAHGVVAYNHQSELGSIRKFFEDCDGIEGINDNTVRKFHPTLRTVRLAYLGVRAVRGEVHVGRSVAIKKRGRVKVQELGVGELGQLVVDIEIFVGRPVKFEGGGFLVEIGNVLRHVDARFASTVAGHGVQMAAGGRLERMVVVTAVGVESVKNGKLVVVGVRESFHQVGWMG